MRCLFRILGLVFLIVGGYLLYVAFIVSPDEQAGTIGDTFETIIAANDNVAVALPGLRGADGPSVAAPAAMTATESRVVDFEWPSEFRADESGVVRVTLRPLEAGGLQAEAEVGTNTIQSTPIAFGTCYASHQAKVSANIIAPEFEVEEAFTSNSQTLAPNGEVSWRWTLTPEKTGNLVFTVVLNVAWLPQTSGFCPLPAEPTTFWSQSVQVEASHVFGLITVPQASMIGTVLAVMGFIGEMPLLSELLAVVFTRRLERGDQRRQRRREDRRNRRRR